MNKLISNYLYTVVYQLLLMITPFITTPYVSRVLQADGVGIDAYITSIVQLFLIFSILSIPIYGSRQIAVKADKQDRSKEFWSIYFIQLIASLIIIFLYIIFTLIIEEHKHLFWIHIISLIATTVDISWFFIGTEQIKGITIRNVFVRVISIILIFVFVNDAEDLSIYILIHTGTFCIGQLIMWFPLLKEISVEKVSASDIKKHFKPIVILFLPQIMIQIYVLINKVILGQISGEVEVGYYNQANKIIKIALGLITSLGTVLLPRMAFEFSKGNSQAMRRYTNYSLQFVLLITLPMTFGLIGIAPNFVQWFLGDEFLPVSFLIMLMAPVILFVGLANVFGHQILISTNQQGKYSFAVTIGAGLSLIANLAFVNKFASSGTTLALLVAEGVGAIIQMYYARSYFIFKDFLKLFIKYSLLSILVFVATVGLDIVMEDINSVFVTTCQLIIGVFVYIIGLIFLKDSMMYKFIKLVRDKFSL